MNKQQYIDKSMESRWEEIRTYPNNVFLKQGDMGVMAHFVGGNLYCETLAYQGKGIMTHHHKAVTTR